MTYFRRKRFPMAPNQTPLWHIVADWSSEPGRITALCGYTHKFVLDEASVRKEVKTAKLRCKDCDAKAAKS